MKQNHPPPTHSPYQNRFPSLRSSESGLGIEQNSTATRAVIPTLGKHNLGTNISAIIKTRRILINAVKVTRSANLTGRLYKSERGDQIRRVEEQSAVIAALLHIGYPAIGAGDEVARGIDGEFRGGGGVVGEGHCFAGYDAVGAVDGEAVVDAYL